MLQWTWQLLRGGAGAPAEGAMQFHKQCGKQIKISANSQTATRQNADNERENGVVISNRPLKDSELFEVRITGMNDKWTGSIEVGITALRPDTMEMPTMLTTIQSNTWVMTKCHIVSNGDILKENYGITLDSLKVGDRVGVLCTESREFHVFINGFDMGPAVSNIPSSVFGVIDIYGRCTEVELVHGGSILFAPPIPVSRDHNVSFSHIHGRNAIISDNRKKVKRHKPYGKASVFSNRPLYRNELFEISIDKLIDKCGESLMLGVIAIDPGKLDLTELTMVIDASKNNVPVWMLSEDKLWVHGNEKPKVYGLDLNLLPEGSNVGMMVNYVGELHYYLNGQDKGCAYTGIPERVYAAVDVYGQCVEISIRSGIDHAYIINSMVANPFTTSTGDSVSETLGAIGVLETKEITYKHGKNISIDGLVATRWKSHNCGIIVSDAPLCDDMFFQVEVLKVNKQWSSGLVIGVTSMYPMHAVQLPSASDLKTGTVIVDKKAFFVNGHKSQDVQNYNLQTVKSGDRVGIVCTSSGVLLFYVNGHLKGKLLKDIVPKLRHALVDLYGDCDQVKLLPLEKAPSERELPMEKTTEKIKKSTSRPTASSSISPPSVMVQSVAISSVPSLNSIEHTMFNESISTSKAVKKVAIVKVSKSKVDEAESFISQTCPYQQLCERFLNTLSLPGEFFERVSRLNLCYCEDCLKGRKDKKTYMRGDPPKKYTLPTGWARFSLKVPPLAQAANAFDEWHIAFHGTAAKNVKKILDTGCLVLPGSLVVGGEEVNQPEGHFTKDDRPKGFDVDQIFVSPSIKYSGCEAYAKATKFSDTVNMKKYKCRVAFQVLIKPDSYKVGRETLGYGHKPIDDEFDNSKIEWSTKEYGTTVLYGLLINAEEIEEIPLLVCPYRKICQRFLKILSLPEPFFKSTPDYNSCFCENCFRDKKQLVCQRGNPPKKYVRPIGWTRFSLKVPPHAKAQNAFKEWHVAFHGTAPQNVRKILDTGGLVVHGPGAVASDKSLSEIIVSPSIKYTGCEKFTKCKIYKDAVTKKHYKCRVVFQVLIKPDSYTAGRETVGFGDRQIDNEFKNSEIEWSTKQIGTTVLYGLMIKAEEQR